ncbi:SET domain-containing protein [Xylaria nigripes]|nr:SET domain-containing protein [Xylaria nigripes]
MATNAGVEVKESQIQDAGKGLFARNAFSAGDIIVTVDRPFVAELEDDRLFDACAWCCQRAATDPLERATAASIGLPSGFLEIKSCTQCKRVGYCSKKCQSKAWKHDHKSECLLYIANADRPNLPPGVRATAKVLGRLKANPEREMMSVNRALELRPAAQPNVLGDMAIPDKKYSALKVLAEAAYHFSGKPTIDGLDAQSTATRLLINIMCNAITLSSPFDNVKLGIGFDPLIGSANHSCEPNAIVVFNQPELGIRALRPIKAGEEILVSYQEATDPFGVRQAGLKDNYHFTCQCIKCKKGAGLETDQLVEKAKKLSGKYRDLADKSLVQKYESKISGFLIPGQDMEVQKRAIALQLEAYATLENKSADLDDIKRELRMCIDSKLWSWTHQPVPQLCRRLLYLYIESGSIYRAFRMGVKLHVEILPALYPEEFYPDRLINAWVTSTVINVLCGPAHKEVYDELAGAGVDLRLFYFGLLFYVYENTPRIFGYGSPFGKVVESTYNQIMAGVNVPKTEIEKRIQAIWPSFESLAHNVDVAML